MKLSYIILKYEKLVKRNFKTLYICAFIFYFLFYDVDIFKFYFYWNFVYLSFLMATVTKFFGTAISQYIKKETFKAEID